MVLSFHCNGNVGSSSTARKTIQQQGLESRDLFLGMSQLEHRVAGSGSLGLPLCLKWQSEELHAALSTGHSPTFIPAGLGG